MATIQNSLRLYDGMTGSLQTMTSSMNKVITTFELMERTSSHAIDTTVLRGARVEMTHVSTAAVGMERNIQVAAGQQENFNQKIRDGAGAASKMKSITKGMSNIRTGIKNIKMGVQFVTDATSLQIVQNQAESKLAVTMRKRMGASPEDIQSIKNLTAAQQHLGVISDEVQLSGAQQMATFLNSSSALNTLVPAMNDLAVQQNGVNVTTQDVTDIGSMMGKAMQGQVDALTSVGITFDAAQAHVLKYGNEQERAAVLAEAVTNNVGNMNEIMASTPQGQIQQLANTWGNIKEMVGAKLYTALTQFFSILSSNMPFVENLVIGLAGVLNVVITMMGWLISGAGEVVGFFQNNWSVIGPVIWGIVGALGVLLLVTKGVKVVQEVGAIISGIYQAAQTLLSIGFGILTGNTAAASAAVMTYNSALLACPITWIIMSLIILIAIVYAVVGGINHFTGSTISATGLIAGAFAVLGAFIINTFVIPLWNVLVEFINFFYNVWNDWKAAFVILFADLAINVIDQVVNMAHAIEDVINRIPGVNIDITSGLDNFRSRIEATVSKIKTEAEWEEVVSKKEFIDYGDTAKRYYNSGAAMEDKVKGFFDGNGFEMPEYTVGAQESWDNIAGNTGNTAGNTAAMADSMGMMDEDLKYMRDMAEQEIINRFTTAELTVQMGGITNQINGQMDLDGIGDYLGNVIFETLETAAEGVY